ARHVAFTAPGVDQKAWILGRALDAGNDRGEIERQSLDRIESSARKLALSGNVRHKAVRSDRDRRLDYCPHHGLDDVGKVMGKQLKSIVEITAQIRRFFLLLLDLLLEIGIVFLL